MAERHSCAKLGLLPGYNIGAVFVASLQLLPIGFKFPVLQFPNPHIGIVIKELESSISPSYKVLDVS